MYLEHLEGLHDEIAESLALLLPIIDVVAQVLVCRFEHVENGQDLAVVRHEGLSNRVTRDHECLQHLLKEQL